MPAIAGIVGLASSDVCQQLVRLMLASMMHEQTYASGTHFAPDIGVYAGWIAHAGSFADRQCAIAAADGTVLLFAGECLALPGESGSATSTIGRAEGDLARSLLRRYDADGPSFVGSLNGLFSGLVIDAKRKSALLFNDRYGMERIYFYEKGETTFFASEAKALLAVLPELRALDDEGVAQFLSYGSTLNG